MLLLYCSQTLCLSDYLIVQYLIDASLSHWMFFTIFLHPFGGVNCDYFHKIQSFLTKFMSLSPSRSLQLRFFSRWASSMTTQRQCIFFSSGQSAMIISNVVITPWNLNMPDTGFPCTKRQIGHTTICFASRWDSCWLTSTCDTKLIPLTDKFRLVRGRYFLFWILHTPLACFCFV